MPEYKSIHISCGHEKEGLDGEIIIPDYHPLSKRQIRNLLCHARQTGDFLVRNSIQIRLCQGIKGYVCPRPMTGEITEKELAVSKLYLDNKHTGPKNSLVNKLFNIMISN